MRVLWGIVAMTAAAALIGCGGSDSAEAGAERFVVPREVQITLDNHEGPESMGILMAEKRGYFDDAGIFTGVTTALTPTRAVQYVVDRGVDIAVVHEPQAVLAKEKGAPIVAVGSLVSRPTAAMIWLKKSKIRGIADLRGKTIAIPRASFFEDFLEVVLARGGLTLGDVEVKRVGYDLVPPLVKGDADAIFGGSWNLEGETLESRGLKPVIRRVQGLGIPSYDEAVLIARADRVADRPGLFRDFMSALSHGAAAAIEDPEAAVEVIEESGEADIHLSRKAIEAQVESTLPLLSRDGYIDPGRASDLAAWMQEEGMIKRPVPISELLADDYLEPQP